MAWIDPIALLVSEWCMKCPQYVDQASLKLDPNLHPTALPLPILLHLYIIVSIYSSTAHIYTV